MSLRDRISVTNERFRKHVRYCQIHALLYRGPLCEGILIHAHPHTGGGVGESLSSREDLSSFRARVWEREWKGNDGTKRHRVCVNFCSESLRDEVNFETKKERKEKIFFFYFSKLHGLDVERVGRKYFNLRIRGIWFACN